MSQLRAGAEGATRADPEVVWSLVADANSYPRWGPWNDGGYRPPSAGPSRKGMVQWFRKGRLAKTTEQILDVEAPQRLVYAVVRGMPVKNYRAEVTLTPTPNGTSIRWAATWDNTFMGRLVRRRLQQVYDEVMEALVAAADRKQASGPAR